MSEEFTKIDEAFIKAEVELGGSDPLEGIIFVDPVLTAKFEDDEKKNRNLATIQRIKSIEPIEKAEKIELVKFEDVYWQSVVKKGEFKVGDLIVYIMIDTILPDAANWAQFLKGKDGQANEPIRLKSATLRGALSQGLVLPLSVIPGYGENRHRDTNELLNYYVSYPIAGGQYVEVDVLQVGYDATSLIGVKKYEKPISPQLAGQIRGNFPFWLKKTDEERLQNYPRLVDEILPYEVYISMKMDGSSMTAYSKDGEFGVCSRNLDLKETEGNSFWKMARELELETKLLAIGNYSIQGELCGPGINQNKIGLDKNKFFAFNIWDIENQKYTDFDTFLDLCRNLNINPVPVLNVGYLKKLNLDSIGNLLDFSNKQIYPNSKPAEGIVIRPTIERYSDILKGRLSFKVISNTFAVQYGE